MTSGLNVAAADCSSTAAERKNYSLFVHVLSVKIEVSPKASNFFIEWHLIPVCRVNDYLIAILPCDGEFNQTWR